MDRRDRWEWSAPLSGVVFVASFLGLFFLFFVPEELPRGAGATEIAAYYAGRGQGAALLMFALFGLAGVALLSFTGNLRSSLRRAEPAPGPLSASAMAGGTASAALFLSGGSTLVAPFVMAVESGQAVDPAVYHLMSTMGFLAINFSLLGAAVMVVATSLVAVRWGPLPAWFGRLGFIVAPALALNALYFFGLFVWVGWVLLGSILMLAGPSRSAPLRSRTAVGAP